MAVISYDTDIAPHLKRGLAYRRLRVQRWQALHAHDHDPFQDHDPYGWAKEAGVTDLLIGLVVLVYFAVADSAIFRRFEPRRSQAAKNSKPADC